MTEETSETTNSDIEQMSYEAAREELISVVKRLEGAQIPLDQTLQLWERGEALVQHCQQRTFRSLSPSGSIHTQL